MLHKIKRSLYFVVATYFAFWAKFVLRRWQPQIVIITGSSGKTTLLHLVEAQIGDQAVYSHRANSSIGIPLHILGLDSNVLDRWQWINRTLAAPFAAFRKAPSQKLYIVEADCDRPHEGKFIANFLKPDVVLWVSIFRTHSAGFDRLVRAGLFKTHEDAIAHEFGYFIEAAKREVIINSDQEDMVNQLGRVGSEVLIKKAKSTNVDSYELIDGRTAFKIGDVRIDIGGLLTPDTGISLQMVNYLLDFLGLHLDPQYKNFEMPPGRNNILDGRNHIKLIDSTYNTGLGATKAVLNLFKKYPSENKWLVMGDILELGSLEEDEHKQLAKLILNTPAKRVILIGPRTSKYVLPILKKELPSKTKLVSFDKPDQVLDYLNENLTGNETVLFKGGRYLEGVIEELLADPKDASKLVRRESIYVKRRQQWGLPK